MRPIIHIGYNKTGTTWLQQKFFPYVENVSYIDRETVNQLIIKSDFFLFNPNEVKNHLVRIANKRILISEEEFCLSPRAQTFIKIGHINQLYQIFPDSKIIIFIRNQLDILLSSYLYYLKWNGGTFSFCNFIFKKNKFNPHILGIRTQNLKYHFFLNYISNLFGKSNVYIYLYEDFANNNISFLNKFCSEHSLDVDLKKLDYSRINEALKINFVPLARFVNMFTKPHILQRSHVFTVPYLERACRKFYPKLNSLGIWGRSVKPEDLLSPECIDYLNNYYRDSNRILAEKYSLPLEKYGYPI